MKATNSYGDSADSAEVAATPVQYVRPARPVGGLGAVSGLSHTLPVVESLSVTAVSGSHSIFQPQAFPPGVHPGDVVLCVVGVTAGGRSPALAPSTATDGWSQIGTFVEAGNASAVGISVFGAAYTDTLKRPAIRVVVGSNITVSYEFATIMLRVSGASVSNLGANPSYFSADDTDRINQSSVTTLTADALLFHCGIFDDDSPLHMVDDALVAGGREARVVHFDKDNQNGFVMAVLTDEGTEIAGGSVVITPFATTDIEAGASIVFGLAPDQPGDHDEDSEILTVLSRDEGRPLFRDLVHGESENVFG